MEKSHRRLATTALGCSVSRLSPRRSNYLPVHDLSDPGAPLAVVAAAAVDVAQLARGGVWPTVSHLSEVDGRRGQRRGVRRRTGPTPASAARILSARAFAAARPVSAATRGLWDSPRAQPRQGRPTGRSGSTRHSLRRGGSWLRHQLAVFRCGRPSRGLAQTADQPLALALPLA
jgi:hypothetical protein